MSHKAHLISGTNGTTTPMAIIVSGSTGVTVGFRNAVLGQRGRSSAWKTSTIAELSNVEATDIKSTVFSVSDRDLSSMSIGQWTNIGVKAMAVLETSVPRYAGKSFQDHVIDIVNSLSGESTQTEMETETMAPAFTLSSVPDIKWSNEYINRKVLGELSDFEILDVAMREQENVLFFGHAGSGKTMCAIAYAANRGYRYYNVSSHNGVEPTQLFGKWIPTPDGKFRWQDGPVTDLVRNGGVLLINEVNFMPEKVKTVLFSLLDKRREIQLMDKDGEVVKAHPELLIISDMNPNYRGTKPLNEAEKDRYAHKLEFPYDKAIESKLVPSKSLLQLASELRVQFDAEEIITPISTRSLVAFCNNAKNLGLDYAVYSFVNGFHESERKAVSLAVETKKWNIGKDLGIDINIDLDSVAR